MRTRDPHPLDQHPSYRAVIEAAPAVAQLSAELVTTLVIACGDLVDGFAAPPDSRRRRIAHHRAWLSVREIDRAVTEARRRRTAPPAIVHRAQRAIDRADVLVGALLPV
jgi:hypothetical protein